MGVSLCRLLLAIIFFCRPQNSRTHCVYIHQSSQEARRIWKELVGEKQLLPPKRFVFMSLTVCSLNFMNTVQSAITHGGCIARERTTRGVIFGALNNHDTETRWETVRETALEDSEKSNFICSEKKGGESDNKANNRLRSARLEFTVEKQRECLCRKISTKYTDRSSRKIHDRHQRKP